MTKLVLDLPLRIRNRVKKVSYFYLNLNNYRNASYHELNNMKIKYEELIQDQIRKCPKYKWIELEYILFPGSARKMDTNNICSIVDKFFCDSFVSLGKLEDDSYNYIRKTTMSFGEIDRNNPRVEVHISGEPEEENQGEDDMQFQALLDHNDFMTALEQYVRKHIPIPEGTAPDIDITAGRGDRGYSAVVTFATEGDHQEKPSADTAALAQSLKEQGNSTNRVSDKPMDLTKETKEPKMEEKQETVEIELAEEKQAKAELKAEPEEKEANSSGVKPLFNFGS